MTHGHRRNYTTLTDVTPGLGAPKRMRAELVLVQAHGGNPFIDQARILAGAEMPGVVVTAWEHKIAIGAAASGGPHREAFARLRHDLELYRPVGHLLNDRGESAR
jgi:hypothetical protein